MCNINIQLGDCIPLLRELPSKSVNLEFPLEGIIASKGNFSGKAKKIKTFGGNVHVNNEDIIIAKETYPSLILAMSKAKGIITEQGGLTSHAAIVSREMNKPCILPEVGSAGGISSETGQLSEREIKWFMDGVKNFMRHIGMLEGEAKLYDPYAIKQVYHFRSKSAGWFYPLKENDGTVRKGEVIGEVRDFFGNVKEQITAPADGIISLIWTRPAVDQGSILLQMFEMGPKTSSLF